MAQLEDYRAKLLALIEEAAQHEAAYFRACRTHESLEAGHDIDLQDLGLQLVFADGTVIPIQMIEPAQLVERLVQCVNFLGQQVIQAWDEIASTAALAKQYCDAAAVPVTEQQVVVPATQPQQPQQPQPPQQTQPPQQPQQQQPRLNQVRTRTEPV